MTVHNHPPYRPMCNERTVDGQLRGACLTDDGQPATVCTGADTCDAPTHVHGCYADFLGHCDNPTDHDPRPAPAYLDPLHDELDRLRTENKALRADMRDVEAARANATAALSQRIRWLEEAEARVDQLTDQLTLANDTLRHRATAVNATGHTNDTLRAILARAWSVIDEWADFGGDRGWGELADDIRAALADQEPTSE